MKIFITGANGYVGARIFEYLSGQPGLVVTGGGLGAGTEGGLVTLDITDGDKVKEVLSEVRPDVVIHAAAVAHGAESDDEGLLEKVNVKGTQNVVDAAKAVGAKFVFLSSISALQDMPYGKSKLAGEQIVKDAGLDYLILRPSVIIGSSPNTEVDITFNNILQAIKAGKPVVQDCSWKFQPTWMDHLCEVIYLWLQGKFKDKEPIYPIIPETKSRCEISEDIMSRFGLKSEKVNDPRYENDTTLTTESLERNGLPVYHYDYVLDKVVSEIKQMAGK